MKKNNPYTPIMIREAMGIEPRVYARYEYGREKMADLKGAQRCMRIEAHAEELSGGRNAPRAIELSVLIQLQG